MKKKDFEIGQYYHVHWPGHELIIRYDRVNPTGPRIKGPFISKENHFSWIYKNASAWIGPDRFPRLATQKEIDLLNFKMLEREPKLINNEPEYQLW